YCGWGWRGLERKMGCRNDPVALNRARRRKRGRAGAFDLGGVFSRVVLPRRRAQTPHKAARKGKRKVLKLISSLRQERQAVGRLRSKNSPTNAAAGMLGIPRLGGLSHG